MCAIIRLIFLPTHNHTACQGDNNMSTFGEIASRAYIAQVLTGYSRLYIKPYNPNIQEYSILVPTAKLMDSYIENESVGRCTHELVS